MNKNAKITIEKLEIYKLFNGDIDDFARSANNEQKKEITSDEWYMIDELINDYHIIKRDLATGQFEMDFRKKLITGLYNEEVFQRFFWYTLKLKV